MQSRLVGSARRPLAWLTLCAIAAPTSTAWGEPAHARDPIASLVGALMDDEEFGTSSQRWEAESGDRDDDRPLPERDTEARDRAKTSSASASVSSAAAGFIAPNAFALGALREPLAPLSLKLPPLSTAASSNGGPTENGRPAEQTPPAAPPPEADDGSGLRTAGLVAGGVGLVGLALFAIAGLGAKSSYDKLATECGESPCTDEAHRSDIEGGRMLQTTANIGLAAGLTGLGVGATLLVLGSRSPVEKREPSPSVSANGAMITYGGHF